MTGVGHPAPNKRLLCSRLSLKCSLALTPGQGTSCRARGCWEVSSEPAWGWTTPSPEAHRIPPRKGETLSHLIPSPAGKFLVPGHLSLTVGGGPFVPFGPLRPAQRGNLAFTILLPSSPAESLGHSSRSLRRPCPRVKRFRSKLFSFLREDLGGRSRAGGAEEGAGRRTRFSAVSKRSIDLLSAGEGGRQAKLRADREGAAGTWGVPKLGLAVSAHPYSHSNPFPSA